MGLRPIPRGLLKKAGENFYPQRTRGEAVFRGGSNYGCIFSLRSRTTPGSPKNFEEPDGSEKLGLERPQAEGRLAPAEAENASSASF